MLWRQKTGIWLPYPVSCFYNLAGTGRIMESKYLCLFMRERWTKLFQRCWLAPSSSLKQERLLSQLKSCWQALWSWTKDFLGLQKGRGRHLCHRKQTTCHINYWKETQQNPCVFPNQALYYVSCQHLHFICLEIDLLGSSQCWKGRAEISG